MAQGELVRMRQEAERYTDEQSRIWPDAKLKAIRSLGFSSLDESSEFGIALREGAALENTNSQFILGLKGVVEQLHNAALGGLAIAARLCGVMNEEGQSFTGGHVPKDKDQAETFYREAAKNGDAVAQYEVGRLLVHSHLAPPFTTQLHWTCVFDSWRAPSCKVDEKVAAEALNWYSKAADQGHAQARYQLAALYSRGIGAPRDRVKAVHLTRLAAKQAYPNAQFLLGAMYSYGEGVVKDADEAGMWYAKAAEGGHAHAADALGYFKFKLDPLPYGAGESRLGLA